jgi:hypothetical protein
VIRTFKTWPLVYAKVAIELETLVLKEIICPGFVFRQRYVFALHSIPRVTFSIHPLSHTLAKHIT